READRAHAAHSARQLPGAGSVAEELRRHLHLARAPGRRDLLGALPRRDHRAGSGRKAARAAQRAALPRRPLRHAGVPPLRLRRRAAAFSGGVGGNGARAAPAVQRLTEGSTTAEDSGPVDRQLGYRMTTSPVQSTPVEFVRAITRLDATALVVGS